MKSIKLSIMALAMAGVALLSGCGNKDVAPTVTIVTPSGTEGDYLKGDKIDFTVSVSGENKLTSIEATATSGSASTTIATKTDGFAEKASDDFTFTYEVTEDPYSTVTITVTATDKQDNKSTATYTINVGTDVEENTGSIVNNNNGPCSGAWDLDNDVAVSSAETTAEIQDNSAVGAGLSKTWDGENGTLFFRAASTFDYAKATKASIKAAYGTTSVASITNIAVGDMIIAKFSTDKYAVIKVTEVSLTGVGSCGTSSSAGNNGFIKFDYKK